MPGTDMKRVNYFLGQFLEAQDFLDEQRYHVELRRRRNRLQYGPGILDGLAVTKTGAAQITVGAGNRRGQGRTRAGRPGSAGRPNVTGAAGSTVFVTIIYAEAQLPEDQRTEDGDTGYIRMAERPQIKGPGCAASAGQRGGRSSLASAQLDASSNITTVNTSVRQMASMTSSGDIVVNGNIGVGVTPRSAAPCEGDWSGERRGRLCGTERENGQRVADDRESHLEFWRWERLDGEHRGTPVGDRREYRDRGS